MVGREVVLVALVNPKLGRGGPEPRAASAATTCGGTSVGANSPHLRAHMAWC